MSAPQGQAAVDNLNVGQVSVGTSATLIAAARQQSPATSERLEVTVTNTGAAAIFVGPTSGVTTANGHAIPAGQAQTFKYSGALYGIIASGTATVTFAETF